MVVVNFVVADEVPPSTYLKGLLEASGASTKIVLWPRPSQAEVLRFNQGAEILAEPWDQLHAQDVLSDSTPVLVLRAASLTHEDTLDQAAFNVQAYGELLMFADVLLRHYPQAMSADSTEIFEALQGLT